MSGAIPGLSLGGGLDAAASRGSERARLQEAARGFEAVMLEMLLREVRQTADAGDSGEAGFARGVFQEWQDGQLADSMSRAGGIGLAALLLRQLEGQSGNDMAGPASPQQR